DQDIAVPGGQQIPVDVAGAHRHRVGDAEHVLRHLDGYEHVFYHLRMGVEYREEPCRSALNRVKGMGFGWSLNPYMGCAHRCTFCYVRGFELRADRPSDDRYGRSIRVKVNVAEVLRRELARPSWAGETVAIGAATDPYQPAEGRYKLTRACLEVLRDAANPFSLITRSPMVVRDLDVLVDASARADVGIVFSVPTLAETVWRRTEPGTPPPRRRLEALARLVDAGVKAGVGMAPILPGISANVLHLKPGTREHFLEALAQDWPEELGRYERLYRSRAYLPNAQAEQVRRTVAELRRRHGVRDRRRVRIEPPAAAEQLTLAV